jgi:hypothetical protein
MDAFSSFWLSLGLDIDLVSNPDVKDVGYVIVSADEFSLAAATDLCFSQNYDFPNNCEDYIHRIGRTGVRIKLTRQVDWIIDVYSAACWKDRYCVHVLYY